VVVKLDSKLPMVTLLVGVLLVPAVVVVQVEVGQDLRLLQVVVAAQAVTLVQVVQVGTVTLRQVH
jgi:hypothetical protein